MVLQDLSPVIGAAPDIKGLEKMAYDFWEPQPIRGKSIVSKLPMRWVLSRPILGARAYYIRNVLHDWPDEKCKLILENIKSAMTSESVVLIDEMVIPNLGTT